MSKIDIPDIASQFGSQTELNARFQQIEDELNDKVLYRDNTENNGEPNQMENDIDMGLNSLYNVQHIFVDGMDLAEAVRDPSAVGPQGPQGIPGSEGPLGPVGPAGPQGPVGSEGPLGPQGNQGLAPDSEFGDGVTETSTSVRFRQGDGTWGEYQDIQGEQGVQGLQGVQGVSGAAGTSYEVDEAGPESGRSSFDTEPKGFSYLSTDYSTAVTILPTELVDSTNTGDGTTVTFSHKFPSEYHSATLVTVAGSLQRPPQYTYGTNTITFAVAPPSGAQITMRFVKVGFTTSALFIKLSATSGDWSDPIPFGEGPQGAQGPQGTVGPQGPQGIVGPQGEQGAVGDQGLSGTQGPQGSIGPEGPTGPTGPQGPLGPQGPVGDAGTRGSREFFKNVFTSSWSAQTAVDDIQAGGYNVLQGDQHTQHYSSGNFSEARIFNGGTPTNDSSWGVVDKVEAGRILSMGVADLLPNGDAAYKNVTSAIDSTSTNLVATALAVKTVNDNIYVGATATVAGTVKMRVAGSTLYITNDGTDA